MLYVYREGTWEGYGVPSNGKGGGGPGVLLHTIVKIKEQIIDAFEAILRLINSF